MGGAEMSDFPDRMEAAVKRRLDNLVAIRQLKAENELLNETIRDLRDDWRIEDHWEYLEWALNMKDAKRTSYQCYVEWEESNPDWQAVGEGVRRRKSKPENKPE